jgi:predicted RNA-binding Zn-ribbon protein involved in translation (DUF1610 family)
MADEADREVALLKERFTKAEANCQKLQRELVAEKENCLRARSSWEEEREKMHRTIVLKMDEASISVASQRRPKWSSTTSSVTRTDSTRFWCPNCRKAKCTGRSNWTKRTRSYTCTAKTRMLSETRPNVSRQKQKGYAKEIENASTSTVPYHLGR